MGKGEIPRARRAEWSLAELCSIAYAHAHVGNKWALIAKHFRSRSDYDIKNIFYSTLRRQNPTHSSLGLWTYAKLVGPTCADKAARLRALETAKSASESADIMAAVALVQGRAVATAGSGGQQGRADQRLRPMGHPERHLGGAAAWMDAPMDTDGMGDGEAAGALSVEQLQRLVLDRQQEQLLLPRGMLLAQTQRWQRDQGRNREEVLQPESHAGAKLVFGASGAWGDVAAAPGV
eukprot:XP_001701277.1 predicted protein [Chlamydomonas reinhardtii]